MALFVLHISSAIAILIAGGVLLALRKKAGFRSCFVLGWFWQVLLSLPAGILAALFAWRYKKRGTYKDRFVICMAVLFLVNSLLNVTWFWAGT